MVGHIMSRRQQKKKRKEQGKPKVRTSAKLRKAKLGNQPRGSKKAVDRSKAAISSGMFSGRAMSYRKSQGGPSGRPRGRSATWFEGNPQRSTGKDGITVSTRYTEGGNRIGVPKASQICVGVS